jgi:hypothetical protein
LGDVTPEERITGGIFSSRESAHGFAIQGAVGILQALTVSGNLAGKSGIGA